MSDYKNPTLPIEERVNDLMSRLSIKQKIDQLGCLFTAGKGIPDFETLIPNGIGNVGAMCIADNTEMIAEYSYRVQKYLVENTEFGIPAIIHCEAISGGLFTGATVFPSAIGQAATWNPDIISGMTDIIRKQMYAVGFRQALSPVFDISRDPRWGRLTETYGEDPTIASAMGAAFVKGLQGDDITVGIAATGKHFIGHGITEGGLNMAQTMINERELLEVHGKPFQAAITEAGLMSVMNSYCSLNREPIITSKRLLTDLLRGEMNFDGIVVSDYISVDRIVDPFCVAETYEEAGILALKAGLDVEYPRQKGFTYALEDAVNDGKLDIEEIDKAVRCILTIKFRLGLFENPYPARETISEVFADGTGDSLSLRMGQELITLLKNESSTLPLSKDSKKIAVLGPHGDSVRSFFGTFSYPAVIDMTFTREEDGQIDGEPSLIVYKIRQNHPGDIRDTSPRVEKEIRKTYPNSRSLYQAIAELLPNVDVKYAQGCSCSGKNISGLEYALNVAAQADVIILTLGGKNGWGVTSTVGEGIDSTGIGLPGVQEDFARAVRALGKKTVVIHFDGRPLSSEYVASNFDAIIEAWQPGQFGGQALASVLFGDYNPAGRLTVTAARNAGQLPVYYGLPKGSGYISTGHLGMIENPYGYINDTAFPLFYFGHGLSYTSFEYNGLTMSSSTVDPNGEMTISLKVKNTGEIAGDEVVQLYISDVVASMVRPSMDLVGFKRIHLKAGEQRTVRFTFKLSQLAFLDIYMNWKVEAGKMKILVGASSIDIRLQDEFFITKDAFIQPQTRGFYAKSEIV